MSSNQKCLLIAGAGTGIGRACAVALAQAGMRVVVAGRRLQMLEETAALAGKSAGVLCHAADLAVREQATELVEWTLQKLGRIDVMINAAGVNIPQRTMEELSPENWDSLMQINVTGAYNLMRAVLPGMRERRDGQIINISSIAGLRASPLGGVAYSASKFAMSALGTCVALEEKDRGIRVTNVYPGEVDTPILEQRPTPVSAAHRATILLPEDVAAMITAIVALPARAHVSDIIIKPVTQAFA